MPDKKKLLIIVPAYNEAGQIFNTVSALLSLKDQFKSNAISLFVYVIDDGSTDETINLAKKAGADRILSHKINRGLGAAVRSGLLAAHKDQADIVVKFDADLQHDPNDIFFLISPILNDEADIVYGNRFERIEYRMPFVRRIGNIFFTSVMRWLTAWPLKDSQPGIFAVNQEYLSIFNLPGEYNYTQQILLDAYHNGMRFAHVPVAFRERKTGKSFVSIKYPFIVFPQILMVLVSLKPMRVFVPIGMLLLILSGGGFCWEVGLWLLGKTSKPVLHVNAILGLSLFGLQAFFFGILAELIVRKQ